MAKGEKQQINAEMDKELIEMLDMMREQNEQTRSGFIRWFIREEFKRRELMNVEIREVEKAALV